MNHLPLDSITHILEYAQPHELCAATSVCHEWLEIVSTPSMVESHLWRALLTQATIRRGRLQTTLSEMTCEEKEAEVDTADTAPAAKSQQKEEPVEEDELELNAPEITPNTNNPSSVEVHLSPFMPAGIGYRELFFYSTTFPTQIDANSSATFNTTEGHKHQMKPLPSLPPITYLKGVKASIQKPIDLAEKRKALKADRAAAIASESKEANESTTANSAPTATRAPSASDDVDSDDDSDWHEGDEDDDSEAAHPVDEADTGDEADYGSDYHDEDGPDAKDDGIQIVIPAAQTISILDHAVNSRGERSRPPPFLYPNDLELVEDRTLFLESLRHQLKQPFERYWKKWEKRLAQRKIVPTSEVDQKMAPPVAESKEMTEATTSTTPAPTAPSNEVASTTSLVDNESSTRADLLELIQERNLRMKDEFTRLFGNSYGPDSPSDEDADYTEEDANMDGDDGDDAGSIADPTEEEWNARIDVMEAEMEADGEVVEMEEESEVENESESSSSESEAEEAEFAGVHQLDQFDQEQEILVLFNKCRDELAAQKEEMGKMDKDTLFAFILSAPTTEAHLEAFRQKVLKRKATLARREDWKYQREVQRGRFNLGAFLDGAPAASSSTLLSRIAYVGKRQGNDRCVRTDVPFPTRFHRGTGLPFLNVCWMTRERYDELKRQEEIERLLAEKIKDEKFVKATTLVESKTNDSESTMTDVNYTSTTSMTPMKRKCMDPAAASSSSLTTLTAASSSTSAANGADAKKQKMSSLPSLSYDDSDTTSYSVSQSAFIPLVRLSYLAYFEIMIQGESPAAKAARLADNTRVFYDESRNCVAIGLGTERFKLMNKQPGWDINSYGWHSDDGKVFFGNGQSSMRYSATGFGPGDVVGCGYDLKRGQIFFTKNGKNMGVAFRDTYETLYPVIGVDAPWRIQLNLGSQYPFVFDVIRWEKELMKQLPLVPRKNPFASSASESILTTNSVASSSSSTASPPTPTSAAASTPAARLSHDYKTFQAIKKDKRIE